jgi:RND family efflux transporter MFP subunit
LKYVRQDRTGERRSSRYAPNPVEIQLADETGYPHRGRMVFVDNAIDPRSGTIRAHAEVPNTDRFLTPGMFGRARLLGSGMYHAMLIPDESIVADQARKLAFVVGNDNKVAPRVVETGPLVSGLRVVKSGLAATDRVVLDGLTQLQPGATVQPNLTQLKPRDVDTSPASSPLSAPPPASASEQQ